MGQAGHGADFKGTVRGKGFSGFDLRTALHIGARSDEARGRHFLGSLAALQVFTQALSVADVRCIFTQGDAILPPSLCKDNNTALKTKRNHQACPKFVAGLSARGMNCTTRASKAFGERRSAHSRNSPGSCHNVMVKRSFFF